MGRPLHEPCGQNIGGGVETIGPHKVGVYKFGNLENEVVWAS